MERHRILVIEDSADTRRFLEAMLGKEFEVLSAENGVLGVEYARNQVPDLILLDIMMPMLSGYDTCSLLKKDPKTASVPIIFLSAKNTVADVTQGLSLGADDYIAKPFDYKELVARIRARLKASTDRAAAGHIHAGDLELDAIKRKVFYHKKEFPLTLTEFDLLKLLVTRGGNVVSREDILKEVWGTQSNEANDRTIDVHIRAIRKKIPDLAPSIVSVYGVGYRFDR